MIRLYDYPDCPFCQKVRVVLAEKDLEFERVHVDLHKQEQRSPEFLKLNPYGRVPVLIDEDIVIYDSTIIDEYLDEEYPNPPLMPEDSAGRARVRLLEDFADNSFTPQAGMIMAELHKPRPTAMRTESANCKGRFRAFFFAWKLDSTARNTWPATSLWPMWRSLRGLYS